MNLVQKLLCSSAAVLRYVSTIITTVRRDRLEWPQLSLYRRLWRRLLRGRPTDRKMSQESVREIRRAVLAGAFGAFGVAALDAPALADTAFTSFAFPATGAPTNRTMPDRLADIFNIRDYGASAGSSDNQPAIQAAITASSNIGVIFFPKANYTVLSAIQIPAASNLIFMGSGASVTANFHGFVFDNLSSPYNAGGTGSIEQFSSIQNNFSGNNFSVGANGTWSASGSPTNITLSGSNPGIVAGGALWVIGLGTNSVFVGMITSVASWPTVTVASAAVGSGAASNLNVRVVQCYPAGASWSASAATITMAATRPAGIGTGTYYVYNYENYLADPRTDFPIGTATWTGTTVTFIPGYGGSLQASFGSADRLWFAPAAGCIRYSSVVGATVKNCNLSGFIGVTTSQDKIVPNDPSVGAAEGFHVVVETCNFSNPSGFSGLMGQTGIYFQNNSISINNSFNSMWCGERLSGTTCGILGGRSEVAHFAIIIGGDYTASNNSLSGGFIKGRSMESNLQAIYCKGGSCSITDTGASCNALESSVLGGFYLNAFSGVVENSGCVGNFGTQYAIYIANPGNARGNIKFTSAYGSNFSTPANGWRIPTQAWWGTCETSDNPALVYAFSGLPSGSPAPFEGDTYDISDCNTSTFLATAAGGGSGATAHRRVRYNAVSAVWQVIG